MPRLLVGCEESQRVCMAFREIGWEAYSCDLMPCSGGHPEWHIQDNVLYHLEGWDMMILHPPCTYLSNAGARHLYKGGKLQEDRYKQGLLAKAFFMRLYNANCPRICIENPRPSGIYDLPPATQIIQPCDFYGELNPYTKATLLWLKGLPPLKPVEPVEPIGSWCRGRYADLEAARTGVSRQIVRSKTFYGVAKAMAEQWGNLV